MGMISGITEHVNGVLWGAPMIALMLISGAYFSARTGFMQLRRPREWLRRTVFSGVRRERSAEGVTPFQAMSSALAATLGADLILLSDVSGILDGKGQRIAEMTAAKAEQLIEQGIITDGMIVKVNAALDAARTLGRPVDIASWRHAEQLPALFNGMPMGTRILA